MKWENALKDTETTLTKEKYNSNTLVSIKEMELEVINLPPKKTPGPATFTSKERHTTTKCLRKK